MGISYSRTVRDSAARQGKDLFACGMKQLKGHGCGEMSAPMHWKLGECLFLFCMKVNTGDTPAEAFASINWPEPENLELPPLDGAPAP